MSQFGLLGLGNMEEIEDTNITSEDLLRTGTPAKADFLIVHYVRLLTDGTQGAPLSFVDCLGLYSVFLLLKPDRILLHANSKDNSEALLNKTLNWSIVQTILAPLQRTINGKTISYIAHEADIRKLRALEEYGGIVLDFDVVILNGSTVRALWTITPCFICWEPARNSANSGFLGCRQKNATYPRSILKQYEVAYNPNCWSCNSGFVPWNIWNDNKDIAVLADNVCNNPDFYQRDKINEQRGKYGWNLERQAGLSLFPSRQGFQPDQRQPLELSFGGCLPLAPDGRSPRPDGATDSPCS
ncbi:hypothetical protein RvY_13548 [Ramazzottius varieornatus]|uniref:Alpha-1,4-N-acetylglucosaminyltransferase n=1 Tax=Ramazzottius varieornatus TaxID=947166 RepID=A0A1D1VQF1_RAMVA|nr:hypothetical protein RvY_13548 [Ramazzottius varieornatus]